MEELAQDEAELPHRELANNLATVTESRAGKLRNEGIYSPELQRWFEDNKKNPVAKEVSQVI